MSNEIHPDYARHVESRWSSGSLVGLRTALEVAARRAGGAWVKRVLRGGAWVGMRLGNGGALEVRFYRADAPKTAGGPAAWQRELAVFLKQMGMIEWEQAENPEGFSGPIATYKEPNRLL